MIELCGWLSAFLFAICAIPQAYQCYKQGNGEGLSKTFIWTWLGGEIFMVIYTIFKLNGDLPMMTNLSVNIFFILIILRYVYFPRDK